MIDSLLPFDNIFERICISFHFFFFLQLHFVSYYIFALTESLLLLVSLPFLFGPSNPGLLICQLSSLTSIFARTFLKDELMLGHRDFWPHCFSSIESLKGLQCSWLLYDPTSFLLNCNVVLFWLLRNQLLDLLLLGVIRKVRGETARWAWARDHCLFRVAPRWKVLIKIFVLLLLLPLLERLRQRSILFLFHFLSELFLQLLSPLLGLFKSLCILFNWRRPSMLGLEFESFK